MHELVLKPSNGTCPDPSFYSSRNFDLVKPHNRGSQEPKKYSRSAHKVKSPPVPGLQKVSLRIMHKQRLIVNGLTQFTQRSPKALTVCAGVLLAFQ